MPTLLLRLAGSMQSWGVDSKFDIRRTELQPSKSGVVGLLAAALGIRRNEESDRLEKLAAMRFGVRVDCKGSLLIDTQNSVEGCDYKIAKGKDLHRSQREYLCDAVFLAGFESDDADYLKEVCTALSNPVFPLFLGRRSCPVTLPLCLGIREESLENALKAEPWLVPEWRQRSIRDKRLRIVVETNNPVGAGAKRDYPISFNPHKRVYRTRYIKDLGNIDKSKNDHDPMAEL